MPHDALHSGDGPLDPLVGAAAEKTVGVIAQGFDDLGDQTHGIDRCPHRLTLIEFPLAGCSCQRARSIRSMAPNQRGCIHRREVASEPSASTSMRTVVQTAERAARSATNDSAVVRRLK